MAVSAKTTIQASPATVVEVFSTEEFARHVSDRAGAGFESFQTSGDRSGAFTVTTVRTVSADRLPDMAKKFVSSGIRLTQEDHYSAPAADGSRTVQTDIKVSGVPLSGKAQQQISASGEATVVAVECTVTANIPLVGKKIAATAEPYVSKALSLQASEAQKWIASR